MTTNEEFLQLVILNQGITPKDLYLYYGIRPSATTHHSRKLESQGKIYTIWVGGKKLHFAKTYWRNTDE